MTESMPRVVIVGAGFAGLNLARGLRRARCEVILIDRRNHHLFQPLLYQVAMAELSPAQIARPIREVLRGQKNLTVALGDVVGIDLERRTVTLGEPPGGSIPWDRLVLAAGVTHSYFGREDWAPLAPGLKSLDDATEIRRQFLAAFEAAELETDPDARRAALTFVVIGGGPTGVELAGAIAEIARNVIPRDFRYIDTASARIVLIEAGPRILGGFPERCSADATRQLHDLGVEIRTGSRVTAIDSAGVEIGPERILCPNVLWAAGVKGPKLATLLDAKLDRAGRVIVEPDLSLPGHPDLFAIGDMAVMTDSASGKPVPGVAQGAIQSAAHVARILAREFARKPGYERPRREPFRYVDKGSMAVVGRNKAVAVVFGRTFSGRLAWLLWAVVHIAFLISFRNRLAVILSWLWSFILNDRGARLITGAAPIHVVRSRFAPSPDVGGETPGKSPAERGA
jgi:NADH dehydrogenase